jgi:peptidyl-prolyl cis-trans isomerase D
MQDSRAKADANELLTQLKDKGDDALQADARQLTFKPTGFFKRNEKIPEVGWENEISRTAFSLSSANPLSDNIIKGRQGYYIIRLKDRRLPDPAEFDKEKEALQEELLNRKRNKAFNSWLAQVKEKSDIELQEGFFE